MHRDKRRIAAAIIAIILIIMLVLPLLIYSVSAEEVGTSSASDVSSGSTSGGQTITAVGEDSTEDEGGVYIENVNVTDMTLTQIQQVVEDKMEEYESDVIYLYAGSYSAAVTAKELGLSYRNTSVAKEAYSVGRQGNVYKRFLSDYVRKTEGDMVFTLDLQVSESSVRQALEDHLDELNRDPEKNGLREKKDGTFEVTDKKDGAVVNVSSSADIIVEYMDEEWHGGQGGVTLDAEVTEAEDTSSQLLEVKDVLGEGTTEYDVTDTDRDTNMNIAVALINGTVVYPGETFSYYDTVGEPTPERGFRLAHSYASKQVVTSYGGGVCQVSTTLYRAALEAEMEIVERHPHSMLVSYAEPSLDAMVAWGISDMQFKNNTDYPIYIKGEFGDGKITFQIYGKETRDSNRTIEYTSEITDYVQYDDTPKFQMDSDLAYGYITQTGGINGVKSKATKTVYVDGQQTETETVNEDYYAAVPITYNIGTKGATQEQISAISSAIATGDISKVRTAVAGG